jgi:hypothetical protein
MGMSTITITSSLQTPESRLSSFGPVDVEWAHIEMATDIEPKRSSQDHQEHMAIEAFEGSF